MADQPNVFEGSTEGTPAAISQDLVAELVGDGKKYKTTEDLARSRLEADIHIKRVEKENAEMRTQLEKAKSVEDILEAVKAQSASANETPDPENRVATPGLTAEQVAKMVAEQVAGQRTKEVRDANRTLANNKMLELYGDKAQEVFLKGAPTPALQAIYKELAEVSPEKFIALFQKPASAPQGVDTGGMNLAALNLNQGGGVAQPGTQAFYAKLRKESPKQYYSANVQLQMHKDAMTDPAKYFGRS